LANILRAIANHVKANQNALSQSTGNLNQTTPGIFTFTFIYKNN
jgi:hypothetical protein